MVLQLVAGDVYLMTTSESLNTLRIHAYYHMRDGILHHMRLPFPNTLALDWSPKHFTIQSRAREASSSQAASSSVKKLIIMNSEIFLKRHNLTKPQVSSLSIERTMRTPLTLEDSLPQFATTPAST